MTTYKPGDRVLIEAQDLDEAVARIGVTRMERVATLDGRDAHLTIRRHRGQWRVVVWAEDGRGGYPETLYLSATGWSRDPRDAADYPSASAALDAAVAAGVELA